jgi:hypothetical protein
MEHDATQFRLAQQNLLDIRYIYAVLTDLLHKNITQACPPFSLKADDETDPKHSSVIETQCTTNLYRYILPVALNSTSRQKSF